MILTIDEGTTSTRALMIAPDGQILSLKQKELKQIYPKPGWVEHDPHEIWLNTLAVCREVIQECKEKYSDSLKIESIAITNQRETTVIWDPKTGKAIHNAIVWQCRRTSEICSKLKEQNLKNKNLSSKDKATRLEDYIKSATGLPIDSYFSGTKIKWIQENVKDNLEGLMFGTIDTWLIWNLTLGRNHLTEPSNACRTMLFNIHESKWDETILDELGIPKEILPEVINSQDDYGSSPLFKDLIDDELSIKAVLGDQQAALYAYEDVKITYGTGTFVLIPGKKTKREKETTEAFTKDIDATKSKIDNESRESFHVKQNDSNKGLVESVALRTDKENNFCIEGSIFVGGSIVQWLRDELGFIKDSAEIEALANSVDDNGGVYLIPALAGLGAPFWQENARGTIFGVTRATNKAHIARAAQESIAFRVRDIFEVLDPEIKKEIKYLNVDGGASKNDSLMQFQADLLQIPVKRFTESEMTALGAAKMTGDIKLDLKVEKIFEPKANLDKEYCNWQKYIKLLSECQ